jgi:hypothetical protein
MLDLCFFSLQTTSPISLRRPETPATISTAEDIALKSRTTGTGLFDPLSLHPRVIDAATSVQADTL